MFLRSCVAHTLSRGDRPATRFGEISRVRYNEDLIFIRRAIAIDGPFFSPAPVEDEMPRVYFNCGLIYLKSVKISSPTARCRVRVPLRGDGIQGFARVRANPFLECQDNQRTRSCFFLQTSDLYEGTCCWEVRYKR